MKRLAERIEENFLIEIMHRKINGHGNVYRNYFKSIAKTLYFAHTNTHIATMVCNQSEGTSFVTGKCIK